MRSFSAQYVITNNGSLLKRAIITTGDDGTIVSVEDTGGDLEERHSVEFYNGIIVPGFVNCHCHLELSHLKGAINRGTGLAAFIEQIRTTRDYSHETILNSVVAADKEMIHEGIVLCADICNTSLTFGIKKKSPLRYYNLLEVFGIDPEKASKRLNEIVKLADEAREAGLAFSLVPHSAYSMSLTLLRLLRLKTENNWITSVHFMESAGEATFLENHSGALMTSYERSGLIPASLETVKSHADAVLNEITPGGSLLVVHNTFADRETIKKISVRKNLYWCLCPNSNLYIGERVPPLDLLMEEECEIVIGTDSLASNNKLSILEELKTIQQYFPLITIEKLVLWATLNGARALGEEENFGKIAPGTKPGLILLKDIDLVNMKLLPSGNAIRLI